jgi:hypothetical protein
VGFARAVTGEIRRARVELRPIMGWRKAPAGLTPSLFGYARIRSKLTAALRSRCAGLIALSATGSFLVLRCTSDLVGISPTHIGALFGTAVVARSGEVIDA